MEEQFYGGQPGGNAYQPVKKEKDDSMGFGIAAFILGLLSLLLFYTCINLLLGIAAVVLGIIQLVKHKPKGLATAGIVMAVVSVILSGVLYGGMIGKGVMEEPTVWREQWYIPEDEDFL